MATINISFTIPDDRVADYIAALRYRYGKKPDGTDWSSAELLVKLKADLASQLDKYYRQWKRESDKQNLGIT